MRRVATLLLTVASLAAQAAVVVTDDRGRRVELAAPPQRVVTLMPSLTETVCELQACGRLVGTDRYSDWPASVKALPKLGGLEDTPIERLVSLKPDLVLAPVSSRAVDRLEALGLRVLALEPKSLADSERVFALLGRVLGDADAGPRLWAQMNQRLTAAAARVPPGWRGSRVYFEVASAPYAAGEASFVGETLARLGLGNIVPAAMGPFPKLNPEFVVRARPDLIMASASAVAEMPARPGWSALPALQGGRSCAFPTERYEMLVRPGPRLAEAAEVIAACLSSLSPKAP
jgi:iron complex transport system substrate-binding protein